MLLPVSKMVTVIDSLAHVVVMSLLTKTPFEPVRFDKHTRSLSRNLIKWIVGIWVENTG